MKPKSRLVNASLNWKRIVVPVDFSEPSVHALHYACDLATKHGASLLVLHVVEPLHADMLMDTGDIQRERRRQAWEKLRALVGREARTATSIKAGLRTGHPVEAITRFARESGADLIVLSTHGRTGLSRAFIGSVAERVVRHAPCPVLVVRTKRR